jgi:hypothetical protein
VSLTDRDKKLVLAIVPLVILLGYWFLLLAPKRQEATKLGDNVAKQEQKRDQLDAEVQQLTTARKSFASDYATVVRLGKAVPNTVDMPSLIVQLQKAASGTGINFDRIHAGPRVPAVQAGSSSSGGASGSGSGTSKASSSGSSSGSSAPSSSGTQPAAAAGGEQAGTGFGRATEQANETKQSQDKQAEQGSKGGAPSSGTGSTGAKGGSTGQSTPGAPGLDTVPLEFTFRGSFFDLSDFFHRLKRFVHVANNRISVKGRLMTIDGFDLKSVAFPRLEAAVTATVYLAPKKEGTTGGATPQGPPPGGQSSASTSPSPSTSQPPAAVATR